MQLLIDTNILLRLEDNKVIDNRQKDECRLDKPNYFLEHIADLSGEIARFTPEQIKNFDPTSVQAVRAKSRTNCLKVQLKTTLLRRFGKKMIL